jgi:hypothetical protein
MGEQEGGEVLARVVAALEVVETTLCAMDIKDG